MILGGTPFRAPLAQRAKKMQAGRVSEFFQRVEEKIRNRRLLLRGQKILVAVSGGADSMVLLHALKKLSARHKWKIVVAHFNHQLRGRASDADEKLVRKTAAALQLPVVVGRTDVKAIAGRARISIEMAARKLRHEFFACAAREQKIQTITLAHHADDQVELFFLRVLRGAGGEGLAGMKWCSPSPANKKITLVRPLLDFSKTELLACVRENKIPFRDDQTNFSGDFLRNRIRNELLPLLRKNYQPGVARTVLRLMEIVGAEAEFARESARDWLVQPKIVFEKLPVAVQRKALQSQLTSLGVAPDFELIEQLRESPGKKISVGSERFVLRDAVGSVKVRAEKSLAKFKADELVLDFVGKAGRADFGGVKIKWKIEAVENFSVLRKNSGVEFFDADKIGEKIILRHWRPGDRFQPIGLKSAVKLQDLFVNAKIPAARRRALVVAVAADGGIFWVEGLRIGGFFKVVAATKRCMIWHWKDSTQ